MDRFKKYFGIPLTCLFVGFSAIAIRDQIRVGKAEERNRQEVLNLVNACNQKAAGSDKVISFEEGVQLSRHLGYSGVILEGEKVELEQFSNQEAWVRIGYKSGVGLWGTEEAFRDAKLISKGEMKEYLAH